jgi:tetratricopeptide (TPR) repeat protein
LLLQGGSAALAAGHPEKAVELLKQAVAAFGEERDPTSETCLAEALTATGDYNTAGIILDRLVEQPPYAWALALARRAGAELYARLGEHVRATADRQRLAELTAR